MKTLTVRLPEPLVADIEEESRGRKISKSDVVRERLAGFLVALLSIRDAHHHWAASQAGGLRPPWSTSEAAFSEAYHLLEPRGGPSLSALLRRVALIVAR